MISSRRWTGSRPVRARISATEAARSRWATWRAERLTETSSGRSSGRCSCHSRIWRQAVSWTQRPIGSIRPLSSATGMNSPGSSWPRFGWFQRTSASSAGDLAAGEGDHRLVVEGQLVALDPLAQLALDLEPAQGPGPHLGVEDLAAGAALFLGPVHRRVGVADQHVGVGRLAGRGPGDRDPEAGGDEVLGAVDHVGLGEGGGDAVGDRHRLVLVGEAVDEDAELVAAEAGDDVARAQVGAEARARPRAAARRRRGGRGCR